MGVGLWRCIMYCSSDAFVWLKLLSVKRIEPYIWLRLSEKIKPRDIAAMLDRRDGRAALSRLVGRRIGPATEYFIEKHREAIEAGRLGLITLSDDRYPFVLKEIQDPPPALFYSGNWIDKKSVTISIVGSRRASRRGLSTARRFARELAGRGIVIVSGMARGIDSAAHEGALAASGKTAAVLGCGTDIAYPPENISLSVDIMRDGCLISEFPLGSPPLRYHFPRRNRILSGISRGVVVVEAGIKSGAINTAWWAGQQGREVFAIPGPIEFQGSRGVHQLIREGAQLVESPEEIIRHIDPFQPQIAEKAKPTTAEEIGLEGKEAKVWELLELQPRHIDELSREGDIPAREVLAILLELEIRGICKSFGSGMYAVEDDS